MKTLYPSTCMSVLTLTLNSFPLTHVYVLSHKHRDLHTHTHTYECPSVPQSSDDIGGVIRNNPAVQPSREPGEGRGTWLCPWCCIHKTALLMELVWRIQPASSVFARSLSLFLSVSFSLSPSLPLHESFASALVVH